MGCFYPIHVRPEPYKDKELVPCGKCPDCLSKKRAEWTFRLLQELKHSSSGYFITLTYDDKYLPKNNMGIPELNKRDLQLFNKRLRRFQDKICTNISKSPSNRLQLIKMPQIKYYAVGEYGENTNRPHYHSITFNLYKQTVDNIISIWGLGHVKIGFANEPDIHYVTKYVINKNDIPYDLEQPFSLISNGIGKSYINSNFDTHGLDTCYIVNNGYKQQMPRYLKNKLYGDEEIKEIGKRNKENAWQRRQEKRNKISSTGQNPDQYEKIQKEQRIERFNKLIKKGSKF